DPGYRATIKENAPYGPVSDEPLTLKEAAALEAVHVKDPPPVREGGLYLCSGQSLHPLADSGGHLRGHGATAVRAVEARGNLSNVTTIRVDRRVEHLGSVGDTNDETLAALGTTQVAAGAVTHIF